MTEITLKLLLVNGDNHQFVFQNTVTADEVVRYVFINWPSDWPELSLQRPNSMKLIYRGKIIENTTRISDLSLGKGVTVMHLVTRERSCSDTSDKGTVSSTHKSSHCCNIL